MSSKAMVRAQKKMGEQLEGKIMLWKREIAIEEVKAA